MGAVWDSSRRLPYALVAAAAILPRLGVLLHERSAITASYVDKGDVFARTFLHHGTYGFIPGEPAADRPSLPLAAGLGLALGLGILGNVRLLLLPLVVAAFLLALRRRAVLVPALVALVATAVVVAPWVVRNRVSVGCAALTTDGRALWKANNPNTLRILEHGKWIDDVPPLPGAPPSPQDAGAIYAQTGRIVPTNECAQMRRFRHLAVTWM